jgi:hypothetical protein
LMGFFVHRLPELFDLICSFPLLEDLHLESIDTGPYVDGWTVPLTSPKFGGSLFVDDSTRDIVRALLDLPGGLHFTSIGTRCSWEGGTELVTDLVMRCSGTLESLFIDYSMLGSFHPLLRSIHSLTTHRFKNHHITPARSPQFYKTPRREV